MKHRWNYSIDHQPRHPNNLSGEYYPTKTAAERACKRFLDEPNSMFPGLSLKDFEDSMVAEVTDLADA